MRNTRADHIIIPQFRKYVEMRDTAMDMSVERRSIDWIIPAGQEVFVVYVY